MTTDFDDLDEDVDEDLETVIQKAAAIAAPVFQSQNWTWAFSDTPPTEVEIANTYRYLVDLIQENPDVEAATGRLVVMWEDEKSGLSFSIELGNWWAP